MKNPEKQWIKKVDAAMILVMRRCLRNYFFFWPNKAVASYSLIHSIVNCRLILMFISFYCYCLKENIFTMNSFNEQIVFLMYDQRIYDDEMIK